MSGKPARPSFLNYPIPKEAPEVPYHNDAAPNPVLRGYPLAIAAWILSSSNFVSSTLWKGAKFHKLREIKELDGYAPRHDPTVIPVASPLNSADKSPESLVIPQPRLTQNQPYTSADYVEHYKAGTLTPSAIVEALLTFLGDESNSRHAVAFLQLRPEHARKAAQASDQRYREGKPLGPLDGVPVAVKDEAELAGCKRTLASRLEFTAEATETAWCVGQWEKAGAIVIGKTNMHEVGVDTTNNNPHTGTPLNPHNPGYYTGGSSGGSGFAISSGLIPIALGADGGGSIRIPSSLCGLYGLKPSHGRISGLPTKELGFSVGVYGPMASSLADLRLAYRIMAEPDPNHPTSRQFPSPSIPRPTSPSEQKYLGICPPWLARASPAVRTLTTSLITYYTSQKGYIPIEIPLPLLPQSQKSHALTILTELNASLNPTQLATLSHPTRLVLTAASRHATAVDFIAAQKLRNLMMRHLASLWERYPGMVVVSPTMPDVGLRIKQEGDVRGAGEGGKGVSDGDATVRSMEFVFLANWTGCPAVSAPVGYADGDGEVEKEGEGEGGKGDGKEGGKGKLPVGIMGMGEWGSEEALMDWVEDGKGFLETEGATGAYGSGSSGIRKPAGWEGAWVDVLDLAKAKK